MVLAKSRQPRVSIRWPDLVKVGVPTLFVYGMMGTFPAIVLFSYFIFIVHFSRRFCASYDIPERATTDHACRHARIVCLTYGRCCHWSYRRKSVGKRCAACNTDWCGSNDVDHGHRSVRRMPVVIMIFWPSVTTSVAASVISPVNR